MNRFYADNSFDALRREVDRAFLGMLNPRRNTAARRPDTAIRPSVNVWEDAEGYFVESELPGIQPTDIDIEVVGNELTFKGERKPRQHEGQNVLRSEFPVGKFQRTLRLPTEVNTEQVEALFKNGVLTIRLPKAEAAKPRKITVSS